jgi:hypothetical protein
MDGACNGQKTSVLTNVRWTLRNPGQWIRQQHQALRRSHGTQAVEGALGICRNHISPLEEQWPQRTPLGRQHIATKVIALRHHQMSLFGPKGKTSREIGFA